MELEYYWTREDLQAHADFTNKQAISSQRAFLGANIFIFIFGIALLYVGFSENKIYMYVLGFLLILAGCFYKKTIIGNHNTSAMKVYEKIPERAMFGKRRLVVKEESLIFETDWQTLDIKYSGLTTLTDAPKGVYLASLYGQHFIIPNSAFPTHTERQEFIDTVKSKMA